MGKLMMQRNDQLELLVSATAWSLRQTAAATMPDTRSSGAKFVCGPARFRCILAADGDS